MGSVATQTRLRLPGALGPRIGLHQRRQAQFPGIPWLGVQHASARQLPRARSLHLGHNAPVESFFGLLKRERIRRQVYLNKDAARAEVFDDIEMFYHPKRRHGLTGDLSPVAFERRYAQRGSCVSAQSWAYQNPGRIVTNCYDIHNTRHPAYTGRYTNAFRPQAEEPLRCTNSAQRSPVLWCARPSRSGTSTSAMHSRAGPSS